MANLRPWRKLKLQVFVTDKWNDHVEDQPDGALAQVGGHGAWDKEQAIQVGVISVVRSLQYCFSVQVNKKGLVLKPVQENKRGEREVQFFQTVASSTDPAVRVFADFIPQFHGVNKKMKDGKEKTFLMMENLTNNFSKACIMDIKIGTRTWGPDARYIHNTLPLIGQYRSGDQILASDWSVELTTGLRLVNPLNNIFSLVQPGEAGAAGWQLSRHQGPLRLQRPRPQRLQVRILASGQLISDPNILI